MRTIREWLSRLRRPIAAALAVGSLVTGLVAVGVAGTATPAAAASLTPVTVTIPALATAFTPFFVGIYDGYYKKAGLTVSIQVIPVTLEPQALLGGKVNFDGSLGYVMNAVAGHPTQFPIHVLAACGNSAPFLLVGGTGVTKISQLKGKVIAADAANSQPDLFLQAALAKRGINPGEYQVEEVGAQAAGRWALVQAGKASAAMVDPNDPVLPPVKGHAVLAKGSTYPSIGCGVAATDAYVASHKKIVKSFVAATARASHVTVTDEKQAVKAMKKGLATLHFGYTNAQWNETWKLSKFIWSPNGLPTKASEQAAINTATTSDHLTSPPPASLIFNLSMVPKKL